MDICQLSHHIEKEISRKARKNVVKLYANDFSKGTYRIKTPGTYILKEDITFDPNPDDDWFPTREQLKKEYNSSPFFLGFFAAITIECSYVKIDLNHRTIKQSPMHALQQRFFQTIQFNNSPFIMKQGPSGTFANSGFIPSKYIWIRNGTMGLTSHYCVHGNNNSYVLMEKLVMENFETGGIALNQVDHMVLKDCHIGSSEKKTPVTALYSVLRNILILFKNQKIEHYMNYTFKNKDGHRILRKLLKLQDVVIKNYQRSGFKSVKSNRNDKYNEEIERYIYNSAGMNDGSSIVGIQITPKGVAINSFEEKVCPSADCKSTDNYSETVFVNNVQIDDIHADPVEVISCKNGDKNVVGAMGELVNFKDVISKENKYVSTTINDAHCWLAKLYNKIGKDNLPISTINIPDFMVNWAERNEEVSNINQKLVMRYGLDIMGHVNKGVMGMRIGGCVGINLSNVTISNIINHGKPSKVNDRSKYVTDYVKESNNVSEELGVWYSGNVAYGIIFSSSKNIKMQNVKVWNVKSETGKYYDYFYNETGQKEINYGS